MIHQSLFSGKNQKNVISLLTAELAQRVVKINLLLGIINILKNDFYPKDRHLDFI